MFTVGVGTTLIWTVTSNIEDAIVTRGRFTKGSRALNPSFVRIHVAFTHNDKQINSTLCLSYDSRHCKAYALLYHDLLIH